MLFLHVCSCQQLIYISPVYVHLVFELIFVEYNEALICFFCRTLFALGITMTILNCKYIYTSTCIPHSIWSVFYFVHTRWDNQNSGAVSQKYLLVYDNGIILIVHAVPVDQDAYYTSGQKKNHVFPLTLIFD